MSKRPRVGQPAWFLQSALPGAARFASTIKATLPCLRRMHVSRRKPTIPKELNDYWDRRLFERRDRDNN